MFRCFKVQVSSFKELGSRAIETCNMKLVTFLYTYIEKIIVNAIPNPIYATILFFLTKVLITVGIMAISNVEYMDEVRPDRAVYILNVINIKVE